MWRNLSGQQRFFVVFGVVFLLFVIIGLASPKSSTNSSGSSSSSAVAATERPAGTSASVAASSTAPSTATPAPRTAPPTPAPTPTPVTLSGTGQTATDTIRLPAPTSIGSFTHSGSRNFIVESFVGTRQDLLINTIGNYSGKRPLVGGDMKFQIEADGPWTIAIQPIQCCADSGDLVGTGDSASNQFNPPGGATTWEFSHDGRRNFIVLLHCRGGDQLVENTIGAFSGTKIMIFPAGPCYWEIQADGNWSAKKR